MSQLQYICCSFIGAIRGQQKRSQLECDARELQWTNYQLGLFDYPFADTNRKCLATERLHAQYSNLALCDRLKNLHAHRLLCMLS